jgi:biopolymer transport protein ExbB
MTSMNLFNIISTIKAGGLVMLPIIAMTILSIILIIDKLLFSFRNAKLPIYLQELLAGELELSKVKSLSATINDKNLYNKFVAETFIHIENFRNNSKNKKLIESKILASAQQIDKSFSSSLWVIDTFVTLAPLLGLFGTIVGMMESFKIIGSGQIDNPTQITAGVAQALIATAAGLIVAIFDLFFLNFFNRKQEILLSNIELIGTLILEEEILATTNKDNN